MHCILDIFIPFPTSPRSTSHSITTSLCVFLPPSTIQFYECSLCTLGCVAIHWSMDDLLGPHVCLSVSQRLQRLSSVSLGIWSMKHQFGKILICALSALDETLCLQPWATGNPPPTPQTQGKPVVSSMGSRSEVGTPG